MTEAVEVWPLLWAGTIPHRGNLLHRTGFEMLVLAAQEAQPPGEDYPGVHVVRAPLTLPDPVMSEQDEGIASSAGKLISDRLRIGGKVYVACPTGRNRSCLLCATALHYLTGRPGAWCAAEIRRRFKSSSLTLSPYLEFLFSIDGRKS